MRYTKRTFFEERPTIQPLEFRVKSSEMSECHRSYFQRFLWLRNLNHFVMLMDPDISARSKWREDSYSLDLRVHRQSSRFQRASSTAQHSTDTSLDHWTVAWCFLTRTTQKRINCRSLAGFK